VYAVLRVPIEALIRCDASEFCHERWELVGNKTRTGYNTHVMHAPTRKLGPTNQISGEKNLGSQCIAMSCIVVRE